jgi:RND family efflux transporter MFP subunit
MKKTLLVVALIVVLGAGGAVALKRIRGTAPEAAPTKDLKADASKTLAPQAPQAIELAPTDLATAETREVRRELPLTGQLRPVHVALVRAKVAGEVVEMRVKEGETVKNGQVLARLDPMEHQARLNERAATLAANKATWENNERTRKNNEELLRKGFISQQAYDNTLANSSVALAQVKAAEANVALAQRSVDDTIVKAPWGGMIAERAMQVGDKASIDTKLLTIVDLSRMEVEAAVPASDIPNVEVGQTVRFRVEGFGERNFDGAIARINPQSQAGSRSIMVYIDVPNSDDALKGGMFAKGNITLKRRDSVTAVPITALREERGETVVYAIENDRLARLSVKTGTRNEDEAWVEITQGLRPGARVVKSNLGALNAGVSVHVVAPKSGPATVPANPPAAAAPAGTPVK